MTPRLVGVALVAAGSLLRLTAHRALREAGVTDEQFFFQIPPNRYTDEGPYAWSHHPAYFGSLLIYSGAGMLCLGWGGIVIGFATWPFYEDRIRYENKLRRLAKERGIDGA